MRMDNYVYGYVVIQLFVEALQELLLIWILKYFPNIYDHVNTVNDSIFCQHELFYRTFKS